MLKNISFFTGIAGFDLAFERAGITTVGQCEFDKHCHTVLETHYPDVERIYDIKTISFRNGKGWNRYKRFSATDADVFTAGFPCQDVSVAGKRRGLAGSRSGLWFEFHRIVTEYQPNWVVLENVPGLLSSNRGRDFAVIIGGLTGIIPEVPEKGWGNAGFARGAIYSVAWRILDAQYFGVAQRRRRVFIVANARNWSYPVKVLFEPESCERDTPPSREKGEAIAFSARNSAQARSIAAREEVTPPIRSGSSGTNQVPTLNSRNNRLDGESQTFAIDVRNMRIQPDEISGTLQAKKTGGYSLNYTNPIVTARESGQGYWIEDDKAGTLRAEGSRPSNVIAFTQNTREEVRKIGGDGQIAGALGAETGTHQQNYIAWHENQGGNLAVDEDGISKALKAEASHNYQGIAWQNKQQSGEVRVYGDTVPTMSKYMGTGGNNVPMVGVRRLTPVECERLQGFSDNWTAGQSDTQRYKQLGNAVAVPVGEWIAKRIVAVENGDDI